MAEDDKVVFARVLFARTVFFARRAVGVEILNLILNQIVNMNQKANRIGAQEQKRKMEAC